MSFSENYFRLKQQNQKLTAQRAVEQVGQNNGLLRALDQARLNMAARQGAGQTGEQPTGNNGGNPAGNPGGQSLPDARNAAQQMRETALREWQKQQEQRKRALETAQRDQEAGYKRTQQLEEVYSPQAAERYNAAAGQKAQNAEDLSKQAAELRRQAEAVQAERERKALALTLPAYRPFGWSGDQARALETELRGLEDQARKLTQQADELERQSGVLRWNAEWDRQREDYLRWAAPYMELMKNEDFAEKSKYITEPTGKTETGAARMLGTGTYTGKWEFPLYEAINGNEAASLALTNRDLSSGNMLDREVRRYDQLTAEERAIFNYLYRTRGQDAAYDFYNSARTKLNVRAREVDVKQARDFASEHPVAANALSVLMAPTRGVAYAGQGLDLLATGKIDQNAGYNALSYVPSAIREQTSEDIQKNWGNLGVFGYQTFMSMADFLTTALVSGGLGEAAAANKTAEWISLGMMGTGAAADTVISAKDRGVDDGWAFVLGTVAGAAEIATEKVSLETLLNPDLRADGKLRYILKNALAEGAEEGTADLVNFTADLLYETITRSEKSELQTMIRELMEQGHTRPEATGIALGQKAEELGLSVLGGALSGGVMAGGNVALGDIQQAGMDRDVGRVYQDPDTARALVQEGLDSAPDSEARRIAERNLGRLEAGQALSARRLGQQVRANEAAIAGGELKPLTLPSLEDSAKTKNTASDGTAGANTRLTEQDLPEYLSTGDRQHVRDQKGRQLTGGGSPILYSDVEIRDFIQDSIDGTVRNTIKGYGRVGSALSDAVHIADPTLNIQGYYLELESNHLQHLSDHIETDPDGRNVPLTAEQALTIPDLIDNATDVIDVLRRKDGSVRLKLGTRINGYSVVVEWVSKGRNALHPVTAWAMDTDAYEARYRNKKTTPINTSHAPESARQVDINRSGGQQPQSSAETAGIPTASVTPEAPLDPVVATTNNIAQQQQIVKGEPESFSDIVMKQLTGESGIENQTGGIIHAGEEAVAGTQSAQAGGAGQNALGAHDPLYGGDAGRRAYDHGTAGTGAVRGGSRENRALTAQRQQAAADQPLVSPADMGIENGSQEATLRILPEDSYDQEARDFTDWAYGKGIRDVKIVVGLIQIQTEHGEQSVLDVINKQTGTLIIRGDSLKRSLTETGRHAIGHFVTGRKQVEAFAQTVKSRYKEAAWGQMYDVYKNLWSPMTEDYAGMTAREAELYVWEEILEDAYANADGYGTKASVYHQEALEAIDGTGDAATDSTGVKKPKTNGPEQGTSGIRGPPNRSGDEKDRLEKLNSIQNVRFSVDEGDSILNRSNVLLGEEDQTYTETDRPVDFTWAVVPADSLIVSNDQHGNANPAYPAELQPRDRSRAASQAQIQKMSRGLIPRKLAESPTAQNGAPIIRADGVVIGGNARSAAIVAAYEAGMAEDYEKFIRDRGGRYGIDTAALPDKPVLVRVAKGADNWAALAQDLNVSSTAAYSTTETAMADAKRMDGILDLLQPNDAGDINTAENSDFIQAFLSGVVSASERSGLVTGNGLLSQAGLERAKNAIFAYAYGNPDLMARYSESLDNDMKNVTNALMQSAPAAVALRTAIEQGAAYDVPAVQTVLKGLEIYGESKRTGKTVAEQVAQMDLLDEDNWSAAFIAEFIEANKRSAKQLRTLFNSLYDAVEAYGDPKQESLFGGEEHDIREALDGALSAYERETGRQIERPDYWRDGGYTGMDAGFGAANPGESDTHDAVPDASGQDDAGENGEGIQKALRPLSLPTLEETRTEPPAQEDLRPVQLPTLEPPKRERNPPRPKPQPHKPLQNRPYPEEYNSVEEYQASIEARAAAAREERLRNVSKENFIGTPALATLGVKIENSVGIYSDIDRLIAADRAAKQIQKATRRAEHKLGATEKERNFASGIAAGIYTVGDIPASMDSEKVMELADYYAAEKAVATDRIRQQRTEIGRVLDEKMEDLFRDSDDFKPSRAITLNYRTPERNMLHIFGDKRGKEINAAIFGPVAVNEAERIRFINRMHNEVRTFQDKNGRQSKLTKPERAIVQQVIEGKAAAEMVAGAEMRTAIENAAHNIRNGADAGDAAREFGLSAEQRKLAIQYARWLETEEVLRSGKVDAVKVEAAVDKYSEMFNKFYAAINDFLVAHGYEPIGFIKGYAPHIQPEQQQNLLNKAFRALGINTDVTRLPSDIAGLTGTYRPNKRWNPYFLQRTEDVTQYDIASAYESYVDYMSDVIYHTDDIMRVRAATRYFRQTYAPEEIKNNLSWASELRYGSTEGKANFLRDQGVIDKATAMTPADVDAQMEAYVEKMFGDIKKTTKYSDLVVWLDNYANILAGKQSMADRSPESMFGREVLNVGNRLIRTFAQANVAGNLSSVLNQSAQIPMIQAELGTRWTAAAIKDIITGRIRRGEWAGQSDFLTGKHGIEYLVSTPGEMVISALFKPAELMDTFVSTVAVRGRYLKEIHAKKSHTEAMRTADAFGTAIMGSRMKGSKPLAFHSKNPIYQMVNIFQIEAFNSWEHVKEDLPRDFRTIEQTKGKGKAALALAGVLVKGLLLAFLMNRLAEKVYGGTPAPFDLLGLTANFVASGEGLTTNAYMRTLIDNAWERISGERLFGTSKGKEKPFDWEQALEDLGYNVTNDIPFLRNAAGLLGIGDETLPMPDLYGSGKDLVESLKKNGLSYDSAKSVLALLAQLLPGGRQLYKTAMGTETVMRGGDFSGTGENEKLKYPTDDDFWSTVQAMLMGKYATEASDAYYAAGDTALSAKQTRLWRSLTEGGADKRGVYDAIKKFREIQNAEDLDSYEKGVRERDLIAGLDMTDDQKLEMYRELTSAESRADKFQAIMDTGLSFGQVMGIYDKYAELDETDQKGTEKATAFAAWVDQQGYKAAQEAVIKDQLRYWNIIPADADRYEKLTDAGLESRDAGTLTRALAALQPEDGNENVSKMQQYREIAKAKLSSQDKLAAIGTIMGSAMTTEDGNPSAYAKLNTLLDAGVTLDQYLDLHEAGAVDGYMRYTSVSAGRNYGITPDVYIDFRARLPRYDADHNGSFSQKEVQAALDSMGGGGRSLPSLDGEPPKTLTNTQKAVLWQLYNKSWKPWNNPFDRTIGQWVYDALNAKTEDQQSRRLPSLD